MKTMIIKILLALLLIVITFMLIAFPDRIARAECLGTFKITTYADTPEDQEQYVGQTSTGAVPTIGRTIAVDPRVIPYGTWVFILAWDDEGDLFHIGYRRAEDCGGAIKSNEIDLLVWRSGATYTGLVWVAESKY